MNDEELKDLWQRQKLEDAPPMDARAQIEAMRARMAQWRRDMNARDFRELAAFALVIIIFGAFFFATQYPVKRLGALIVIGGALFISLKMMKYRRRASRLDPGAPVAVWLKQERERVHHEAELVRTILWWYLLPLWLGVILFTWGDPNSDLAGKIGFTVFYTLISAWLYWLNQSARRKRLLPLRDELETLLQEDAKLPFHAPSKSAPDSSIETAANPDSAAQGGFHLQFSTGNDRSDGLRLLLGSREIRLFERQTKNPMDIKTKWLLAMEWMIAAFALGLGLLAWHVGLFINFIAVLLLLLAPMNLIRVGWKAWKKEIYWGLLRNPFTAESRRYWWPCFARIAFFVSCGYLLQIGVVPYQFPEESPGLWPALNWSLALFLAALNFLPARRISRARTVLCSVGAVFMVWQFVQIALPPRGEAILLSSPLPGITCVMQGGNSSLINHHYGIRAQRHAVDLFKVAETIEEVRDWKILEEDASFGQTILSPCDGRIAHVEDSHSDNPKGETNWRNPAGNYLTVEIAPGRYIFIAHLKSNSISVKPGDKVTLGQPIAQCGNSGNTSGPHVHLQAQSSSTFSARMHTFPIAFRNVVRDGEHRTNLQPRRNDLLLPPESR